VGLVIGVVRMIVDFVYPEPHCGEVDPRPAIISKVHYMYFALMLFGITGLTMVIVSFATSPPSQQQVFEKYYIIMTIFSPFVKSTCLNL
jgi:hypothetical protein